MGFYKNLFGPNLDCSLSLSDYFWPEELKLNETERGSLILPFQPEEVKGVVMNMKVNSAPGLNGFSVVFFPEMLGYYSRRFDVYVSGF